MSRFIARKNPFRTVRRPKLYLGLRSWWRGNCGEEPTSGEVTPNFPSERSCTPLMYTRLHNPPNGAVLLAAVQPRLATTHDGHVTFRLRCRVPAIEVALLGVEVHLLAILDALIGVCDGLFEVDGELLAVDFAPPAGVGFFGSLIL